MLAHPPSHSARLQLLLIRSLYERALSSLDGSDVGAMSALLLADLAIETALKAALFDKNVEVPKRATVPDLVDLVAGHFSELANSPVLGMAKRIREARNPVQHAATPPARGSLHALLNDAGDVLTAVVGCGFGVDLANVSAVSLVADAELRMALEKARELCAAADFDGALRCSVAAFDSVCIRLGRWVRKAHGHSEMHDRLGPWVFSPEVLSVFGAEHGHAVEPAGEWRLWVPHALNVSLSDLVALRLAKARCAEIRLAAERQVEAPASSYTAEGILDVIETVARNIWRLEASQPELFLTDARSG